MAGPYYVDPAATGSNNGSSWTHAWTSLQSAADTAAAGETVYCRGTELLAAAIDIDTNAGTYDGGYIKFIGCNASGDNDGTYFALDGQDNNINGLAFTAKDYIWIENFKIQNCGTSGGTGGVGIVGTTASQYGVFLNVWCYSNRYGVYSNGYIKFASLVGCRFDASDVTGVYRPNECSFVGCFISGNAGGGIGQAAKNYYCGCVFHNNTGAGLDAYNGAMCVNCVFDANTTYGASVTYTVPPHMFIGCRFTNQIGAGDLGLYVSSNTRTAHLLGCYFGNNATDATASRYELMNLRNAALNTLGGSDENEAGGGYGGYKDASTDDFNLRDTATLRAVAVTLP